MKNFLCTYFIQYFFEVIKITTRNFIATNNQKHLEISILDQGCGMSDEEIRVAFHKYKTGSNNRKGLDSFGLGLAITKQLVEMQNGAINIKSEVAKGTEVIVRFPLFDA